MFICHKYFVVTETDLRHVPFEDIRDLLDRANLMGIEISEWKNQYGPLTYAYGNFGFRQGIWDMNIRISHFLLTNDELISYDDLVERVVRSYDRDVLIEKGKLIYKMMLFDMIFDSYAHTTIQQRDQLFDTVYTHIFTHERDQVFETMSHSNERYNALIHLTRTVNELFQS